MKAIQRILASTFLLVMAGTVNAQCGSDIDFSTDWAKQGPSAAGNWVVSGGGSTVTQTINGNPTFYVSGTNFIDVVINGTFKVNSGTTDDDWVGFVFGYQDPLTTTNTQKYYLFDWKKAAQNNPVGVAPCASYYITSQEGFSLIKIDTSLSLTNTCAISPLYWDHVSHPGFYIMDSLYGSTLGWATNTTYNFSLTYTSKLIVITIDGDTIFHEEGCYEPGRFGFYNLSQDQAVYSNFSYQLVADFDFSVTNACTGQNVGLDAINNACLTGPYVSPIQSWSWDLGDGTTVNDTNIFHAWSEPGTYNVTLTVGDGTGCTTPLTKPIVINGLKAYQSAGIICPSATTTIWCNLAHSGALYQWFRNGVAVTSPTLNDTTYTVTSDGDYHVEITGAGSYACNTVSNTITVTQESLSPLITATGTAICSGASVTFNTPSITGAQYEWFIDGISQGIGTNTLTTTSTGAVYVTVTTVNGCTFNSNTINLTSGTAPVAAITSVATGFCPGGSTDLDISLLAGETVQWYKNGTAITGATGTGYTATTAGSYSAIVTNTSGCTDESNSIAITIYSVPSATINSSATHFCPGVSSILLTANTVSGATYQWQLDGTDIPGATSSTYTATATGNYQVTITNTSGCSNTSAVTTLSTGSVSSFTLSAAATSFCSGTSVNINTSTEAGSAYTWYNDGVAVAGPSTSLSSYNANAGGTYVVSVTNTSGCTTQSDTVTLTELPLPAASIAASTTALCPASTSLITATFVAGATYEWFKNGVSLGAAATGANTITATTAGDYYVMVNDGCSNTSNHVVINTASLPSPAGAITGNTTFCPGESLVFDISTVAGATNYNWTITPSTAASIGSGQGTDEVVVNTTNANFTLTVTPQNDCGNGTSSSMTVSLETTPGWCFGIMFAANKTNVCTGSTVTYTNYTDASMYPGTTAHWNFGAGASPATATGSGPHTVTYTSSGLKTVVLSYVDDFSGFTVDSETKTDYVNVNGSVSTSAITGNSSVSCSSSIEPYSVTNTPGSTYAWSIPAGATLLSGAGTSSIQVNFNGNGGTVSVTETNAAGCTGSPVTKAITVTGAPVTSAISGNTFIACSSTMENYSVVNTAGSSYTWIVPAGAIVLSGDGTNAISVNFNGNMGAVTVTETNSSGCTGVPVTLNVNCTLGTAQISSAEQGLGVYPNPVTNMLTIDNGNIEINEVVIYDLGGNMVFTGKPLQTKVQVDVSHLNRGAYAGKAVSGEQVYHFRFIKQ